MCGCVLCYFRHIFRCYTATHAPAPRCALLHACLPCPPLHARLPSPYVSHADWYLQSNAVPVSRLKGLVVKPDVVVGSNPLQAIFSRIVEDDDSQERLELYLDLADLDSLTVHELLTDRYANSNTVLHDMYDTRSESVQPQLELLNSIVYVQ